MPSLMHLAPRTLRTAKILVFALASLGFICAAAFTSALIVDRQRALSGISRYNLTWAASQSVTELLTLEQVIATYTVPEVASDQDEIGIRLDVLANRVEILRQGQLDDVVQKAPELQAIVRDLGDAVDAARPLVDNIDRPGSIAKLLNLFHPLNGRMAHLAAKAHAFSGDSVARDQQELDQLHWMFSGLLMALNVCALVLVVLLSRKAGLIRRAHDELRNLTQEFAYAAHHDSLTGLANRLLFH